MKNRKYSLVFIMLLCMIMAVSAFPMTVNADMGPKASVRIQFEHMGDELCYGTLLSKEKSTGPASAWDGRTESAQKEYMDPGIWEIFVNYKDPDGYYFLQRSWKVSESKELAWTYYPPGDFKILLYYPETETFVFHWIQRFPFPGDFKILLYYPETETFVSSGIYARYAFDTYYTVDMDGVDIGSVEYNDDLSTNERIEAYRSYNYRQEMLALGARIVLTILIEMLVALLFGFRQKKQLLILAVVNVITQIILNVLLNVINYNSGPLAFTFFYVLFELIVFALEAVLYCTILKRISEKKKEDAYYILYSFVANLISFGAGLFLAAKLPGMF